MERQLPNKISTNGASMAHRKRHSDLEDSQTSGSDEMLQLPWSPGLFHLESHPDHTPSLSPNTRRKLEIRGKAAPKAQFAVEIMAVPGINKQEYRDFPDENLPKAQTRIRNTRSAHSNVYQQLSYSQDVVEDLEDEDDNFITQDKELSGDESAPDSTSDGYLSSRTRNKKRKRKNLQNSKPKKKVQIIYRGLTIDKSPSFISTRRSGRQGRNDVSMKEKGEEDIWASEDEDEASESMPRAFAAREIFKAIPRTDNFARFHDSNCSSCGKSGNHSERGILIYCQGCSVALHKSCLGYGSQREHLVTKIGEEDFVMQCRRCLSIPYNKNRIGPRLDICQICKEPGKSCLAFSIKKSPRQQEKDREENKGQDPVVNVDPSLINNVETLLFRCINCHRGFHYRHLPRRDGSEVPSSDLDESILEGNLQQYHRKQNCNECLMQSKKIQSLVAWRPVNKDTYIPGDTADMISEDNKEYLIKWENLSYFRTSWMPGAWVWGTTATAMRKAFEKKHLLPIFKAEEAIPLDYLTVDIILDVKFTSQVGRVSAKVDLARIKEVREALIKFKGLGYEDAVWEEPPSIDEKDYWEDFALAYNNWVLGRYVQLPQSQDMKERLEKLRSDNFESKILLKVQPESLVGGELMKYQLEGVNWLIFNWLQKQNVILADEMGLGKTIQIIGFISALVNGFECWPFLIVVPNSTCANWRREIMKWDPSLRVVAHFGGRISEELSKKYELFPDNRELRAHIVVTSYDTPITDAGKKLFRSIKWAGLIVDEGQRLKNDKNLLYEALNSLIVPFKVLLTGTPLQNNARELFNLLQFLEPSIKASVFEEKYALLDKKSVQELHELIRPFLLRRTKAKVLDFLPGMAQIIVPVTMTIVQKNLYKSILSKDPQLIKAIFGRDKIHSNATKDKTNLNNLLMQLRKCLCHPFVYSNAIEDRRVAPATSHLNLVEAAAKLQLLDIMLPKLHAKGHRVLLFSQFLPMLASHNKDILEDFLAGLQLEYQRLDGSIDSREKQKRIDAFNAPGSSLFAFLLSTRAGGVGINLATADTVIIMDPDFNPHQDMQALSRVHRIGQKKKVLVFQLMTRNSVEEKMIQIGRKKMALDEVLIKSMDYTDNESIDYASILRHGAAALFQDSNEDDIAYDSASVEQLLDRSQVEAPRTEGDGSTESQFSHARIWANEKGDLVNDFKASATEDTTRDPTLWEKILIERQKASKEEEAKVQEVLGRGKRKRQAIDYASSRRALAQQNDKESNSDRDFVEGAAESDDYVSAKEGSVDGSELSDLIGHRSASPASPGAPLPPKPHSPKKAQVLPAAPLTKPNPPKAPQKSEKPKSKALNKPGSCVACDCIHEPGKCALKLIGFSFCRLCSLAHYGNSRTCPRLRDAVEVKRMLDALNSSEESKEIVHAARKYLRGIRGDLARREKQKTAKLDTPAAQPSVAGNIEVGSSASADKSTMPGSSKASTVAPTSRKQVQKSIKSANSGKTADTAVDLS